MDYRKELEEVALKLFQILVSEPDTGVRKNTLDEIRRMVAESGNEAVQGFFKAFCELVEEEMKRRHTS